MEKLKVLTKKEIRIAVLPFKVFTEDENLSPVIFGFTEDLIINFSKFVGLSVISQFSTQNIKDISDNDSIAELNADYQVASY